MRIIKDWLLINLYNYYDNISIELLKNLTIIFKIGDSCSLYFKYALLLYYSPFFFILNREYLAYCVTIIRYVMSNQNNHDDCLIFMIIKNIYHTVCTLISIMQNKSKTSFIINFWVIQSQVSIKYTKWAFHNKPGIEQFSKIFKRNGKNIPRYEGLLSVTNENLRTVGK